MGEIEKKKSKIGIIIAIIIIALVLIVGAIGGYYVIKRNYIVSKINQTNLIINNSNATSSLKNNVYIKNGVVYVSKPDIYNFFDNTIIYDEKYNQVVTTSSTKIASLPIDSKQIQVNSSNTTIKAGAIILDEVAYVPISELDEVYNIKTTYVESEDLVYIDSLDREQQTATLKKDSSIKYKPTIISATLAKAKQGDTLTIANRSDYPVPNGWTRVRTENGTLGYIQTGKLNEFKTIREKAEEKAKIEGPISLAWDYYSEYVSAPTRTGKITGVNVVSPSFFYMTKYSTTNIYENVGNEGIAYVNWAHGNGYQVWPMFTNSNMSETSKMLSDYKSRENVINQIIKYIKQYNLDGINIDFEGMYETDKDNFSRFLIEIRPRLNEIGAVLSVDVTAPDGAPEWSLCYDRYTIGKVADYVMFMAYDQYGVSATKAGTTAGHNWVEANVKKFLGQEEVKAEKIILGIPFYTRVWKEINGNVISSVVNIGNVNNLIPSNATKTWDEDLQQYYVEYKKGGATYKIWVEDEKSIEAKLDLVSKYNLGGAAYWEYDRATNSIWNLIESKIK
ncbi:glycoside hydrolase family 18 [Clostridium sp. CAG:508]|jgi:spore germination protein YaaH|nr:glycoside hydrolase family 18 [Clostridium sp. CAG:508]